MEVVGENNKKFVIPKKPAEKKKKYMEAPILNLKDLLPAGLDCVETQDKSLDLSLIHI